MKAFIAPPKKLPLYLRIGIFASSKATGKDLLVPRLLGWHPKSAISSGVMEALVAHGKKDLNPRLLKLVRVQVSMMVDCPFCVDMNAYGYKEHGITEEEMQALVGKRTLEEVNTFTSKERLALVYARKISETPVRITDAFARELTKVFTEREVVILSTTAAQVNYWARLIRGLGVPPAGFLDHCDL